MNQLPDLLPFFIPLILVEFFLLIITIIHIVTHNQYKRGNRIVWLIISIVGMQFIGPILYFLFGKEDE